jgi:hypothetical protein
MPASSHQDLFTPVLTRPSPHSLAGAIAEHTHADLRRLSSKLSSRLAHMHASSSASSSSSSSSFSTTTTTTPPSSPIRLRPHPSKPGLVDVVHPHASLTLSQVRLATLRTLYTTTRAANASDAHAATKVAPPPSAPASSAATPEQPPQVISSQAAPKEAEGEAEQAFRRALLALLLRYQALDGGGFQ